YNGNYSDYKIEQEEIEKAEKDERKKESNTSNQIKSSTELQSTKSKIGVSFKEQKELSAIENEIGELENKIKIKTVQLETITEHTALIEVAKEIEDLTKELANKETRWVELLEK